MNAGKSTALLQSNYNYNERGMETLLFVPKVYADANSSKIKSRIGLDAHAFSFDQTFNFKDYLDEALAKKTSCIFVDEAQFLTKLQVRELCYIADCHNIPVMCYGIRTDFRGELFEGSSELLAMADTLNELKTVCDTGKKATMVVRLDEEGNVITAGDPITIGGYDRYKAVSRSLFRKLTKLI